MKTHTFPNFRTSEATLLPPFSEFDFGVLIGPDYEQESQIGSLHDDANVRAFIDGRMAWEKLTHLNPRMIGCEVLDVELDDDGAEWSLEVRTNLVNGMMDYLTKLDYWRTADVNGTLIGNDEDPLNIYVHCHMGINRGPSLALYLFEAAHNLAGTPPELTLLQMMNLLETRPMAAGGYYRPVNTELMRNDHYGDLTHAIRLREATVASSIRKMRTEGY